MIRLQLLGPINLTDAHGRELGEILKQPKRLALLAYLAVAHPFGLHRRDKLVAMFWPELDAEHARGALRTALHQIRITLGHGVVRTRGTEEVGLDPALVWCDVVQFRDALRDHDYGSAARLYRGDFLDGVFVRQAEDFEEWLEFERGNLRKLAEHAKQHAPGELNATVTTAHAFAEATNDIYFSRSQRMALPLCALLLSWLTIAPSESTPSRWQELSPVDGPPLGRTHMLSAFNPRKASLLIFGGRSENDLLNDLWRLDNATNGARPRWTRLLADQAAPAPRWMPAGDFDAKNGRVVMFGGALGHTSPCTNETWLLEGAFENAPRWRRLDVTGELPPARAAHVVTYDQISNRLIVTGGNDCIQGLFSDVWVLQLAANGNSARWFEIDIDTSEGRPQPRRAHSGVYDPTTNRLMIFGGAGKDAEMFNDIWVLTNANGLGGRAKWVRVTPKGEAPIARYHHSAVFDPASNRMTIYGGYNDVLKTQSAELWVLQGANGLGQWAEWKQLRTRGPTPGRRWIHAVGYDAQFERMLLAGGHLHVAVPRGRIDAWVLSHATGE